MAVTSTGAPVAGHEVRPAVRPRDRDFTLRRLLVVADVLAVLLALAAAILIGGRPATGERLLWASLAIPIFVGLFKLYGLYEGDEKRISHSTVDDLPRIFHALVIGGLLLWLYSKLWPVGRLTFVEIALFGLFMLTFTIAARVVVRYGTLRALGPEAALVVGSGRIINALVLKLAAHPEYGTEIVGELLADVADEANDPIVVPGAQALPVLGAEHDLERIAESLGVSRVIFSGSERSDQQMEELLRRCRHCGLKISVLPRLSDVLGSAVEIDDVEGVTVLGLNPPWLPRSSRAIKRAMDLMIAAALLVLLLPVLLAVALAVKLDSRGPVFFGQDRVGKGGRTFRLFKFRTMVRDAEARRAELIALSADPSWLLLDRDPRVTRVGRVLRRLSLDELPQLWNVLRGEMSLVGPRPLIPAEDEHVQGWARGRLDLTPGITGYWQVLGRTRIPFEEMVKLDYLYVMNWNLWEDIRLILKTLPVVIGGRGAN
jgi:exopolysaccharide biosynthesis polyprenyl glycosylphosphotransferase